MSLALLERPNKLEELDFEVDSYKDYETKLNSELFRPIALKISKESKSDVDVASWFSALMPVARATIRHTPITDLFKQLIGLLNLRMVSDEDWAEAPNNSSIVKAEEVLSKLKQLGFLPSRVVASAQGGIGLVFLTSDKQADIEILNSSEILAGIYPFDRETEVWVVSLDELETTVERIRGFLLE